MMTHPTHRIVAVAGRKGSGKTTLARKLIETCPTYERVGFADAVKRVCYDLWGGNFNHNYFGDGKAETSVCGRTYRQLMQLLGTEVGRLIDPQVWVRKLFRDWEADGCPWLVIDDLRFPNEAAEVRARGGVVLLLGRGADADAHESESYFDALPHDLFLPDDTAAATWERAQAFLSGRGLCR